MDRVSAGVAHCCAGLLKLANDFGIHEVNAPLAFWDSAILFGLNGRTLSVTLLAAGTELLG